MDTKDLYPDLKNFVGAYFHQNWIDELAQRGEAAEDELVISDMLKDGSSDYFIALSSDINNCSQKKPSEDRLRQIVRKEFRGSIDPTLDGTTWRAWLEHVNNRITEHLKFSLK